MSSAAGYAVFSNVGNNLLVVSSGNGHGVARDRRSGKDTYEDGHPGGRTGAGYQGISSR